MTFGECGDADEPAATGEPVEPGDPMRPDDNDRTDDPEGMISMSEPNDAQPESEVAEDIAADEDWDGEDEWEDEDWDEDDNYLGSDEIKFLLENSDPGLYPRAVTVECGATRWRLWMPENGDDEFIDATNQVEAAHQVDRHLTDLMMLGYRVCGADYSGFLGAEAEEILGLPYAD